MIATDGRKTPAPRRSPRWRARHLLALLAALSLLAAAAAINYRRARAADQPAASSRPGTVRSAG